MENPRESTLTAYPRPVTAAGGVVFRMTDGVCMVLLIHRKGLWDLPKGKLDEGESVAQCAVREVAEETGSEQPIIVKALMDTHHSYAENGQPLDKTTHWYAMITRSHSFFPQSEEDIDEIRWVPLDEAMELVGYDNLKSVLRSFKDFIV